MRLRIETPVVNDWLNWPPVSHNLQRRRALARLTRFRYAAGAEPLRRAQAVNGTHGRSNLPLIPEHDALAARQGSRTSRGVCGRPGRSTIEGPIYRPGTGRRTSLAGLSLRSPR